MANILKRIRKSSLSSSRHESRLKGILIYMTNVQCSELLEDPQSMEDPIVDGVIFLVKYLGQCVVENDSGEEETATAIKNIITTVITNRWL